MCWTDAPAALWVERTRKTGLSLQGRRPAGQTHNRCHSFQPVISCSVKHNPKVRYAVVDPAVSNCLAVVRFFSLRHDHQLQRHTMWLIGHGVAADLHCRSAFQVVVVRRDSGVEKTRTGYAVGHLRFTHRSQGCSVYLGLRAVMAAQAKATVRTPGAPGVRICNLPTADCAVSGTVNLQDCPELAQAISEEHYVTHDRSIAGVSARKAPSNKRLKLTGGEGCAPWLVGGARRLESPPAA